MSLWTKLRDKIIRPVLGGIANTFLPGSGALFTPRASAPAARQPVSLINSYANAFAPPGESGLVPLTDLDPYSGSVYSGGDAGTYSNEGRNYPSPTMYPGSTQTAALGELLPAIRGLGTGIMETLPSLPGAGQVARRVGQAFTRRVWDLQNFTKKGKPRRRRRGRMNPMNARALRRSIRRIRGFQKIEKMVNKLLPKARVHHNAPARWSPPHRPRRR